MRQFTYAGASPRVVFGAGAVARLAEEIDRLGAKRALLLVTPGRSANVRARLTGLGERLVGTYDNAVMHVPVEIAVDARRVAEELRADCCIAWGGGSTIGLGKAIALTSGLPVIAVPTTYSGSEMTAVLGMTEGGAKKTQRDPRVLPKTVVYDPELTLGLPAATSAASGMNAIAHCVEALYAHDANPVSTLLAEEGIRAIGNALPRVWLHPPTSMRGAKRCTAPGLPARPSQRRASGCITSCATCWAARSTCRTPRRTRSCCRTRLATTAMQRPMRCAGSRERSTRRTLRPRSMSSRRSSA